MSGQVRRARASSKLSAMHDIPKALGWNLDLRSLADTIVALSHP